MKAIVLAGGGGTRLWPLSREDFPKQFLNFGSGFSLLQKTIQRLLAANFIEEIIISTNSHHFFLVQQQLEKIADPQSKIKILVEPCRKNTAPAIALAVKYLEALPDAKESDAILVLPSDHLIEPETLFLHALAEMESIAKESGRIITFGIHPTKPETGYGYIQIGKKYTASSFEALRFIEKPDRKRAERYLADPHFYWNAGIFLFSQKAFWQQIKKYNLTLSDLFEGSYPHILGRFQEMPDVSIDFALMEKSKEILVCPLAVSWSDVGSWDSVYEALQKDQNQNVLVGQVVDIDTKNSLVMGGKRLISTIGLEDMLIVETEDALFVSKKGESQKVKKLVQDLMLQGRSESVVHPLQSHSWGASRCVDQDEGREIRKVTLFPGMNLRHRKSSGTHEHWIPLQMGGRMDPASEPFRAYESFVNDRDEMIITNCEIFSIHFMVIINSI